MLETEGKTKVELYSTSKHFKDLKGKIFTTDSSLSPGGLMSCV